jgi:hypothetical protein
MYFGRDADYSEDLAAPFFSREVLKKHGILQKTLHLEKTWTRVADLAKHSNPEPLKRDIITLTSPLRFSLSVLLSVLYTHSHSISASIFSGYVLAALLVGH